MGEGGDSARVCLYQRNATTVVGSVGGSKAVGLVHSDGTLVLALTRGGDVGVVQLTLDQGQPRAADVTWSGGGAQSVRIAKWRHPY